MRRIFSTVAAVRRSVVVVLLLVLAAPARGDGWDVAVRHARAYVNTRAGAIAFALIDAKGHVHATRTHPGCYSATLLKPVILVTYLNRPSVRGRGLTREERGLMEPMIRASADGPASSLFVRLSPQRIQRWGKRHGLTSIRVAAPIWGSTHITPGGYA